MTYKVVAYFKIDDCKDFIDEVGIYGLMGPKQDILVTLLECSMVTIDG